MRAFNCPSCQRPLHNRRRANCEFCGKPIPDALRFSAQKRRFLERIEDPDKNWKFSASDVREREFWDDYMEVYEEMIRQTASPAAPWYVVPADNKWFTRLVVAAAVVEALESLDLSYPRVSDAMREELALARVQLSKE